VQWLTGQWSQLGEVVAKAVLMYAVALVGLRLVSSAVNSLEKSGD